MNNIALVGFMGTGKTSVGQLLAPRLGWHFIDTDSLIAEKIGLAIPEVFQRYGEDYFRQMEIETIKDVCGLSHRVIATGGGVVLNSQNVRELKKHTFLICLEAKPEEILTRVRYDSSRPLLAADNPLKIIKNLLKIRESFYQCADLFIDTSGKSVEEIIEEIVIELVQRGLIKCLPI